VINQGRGVRDHPAAAAAADDDDNDDSDGGFTVWVCAPPYDDVCG